MSECDGAAQQGDEADEARPNRSFAAYLQCWADLNGLAGREGAVPWEITIKRSDGNPLGPQPDIQAAIERAFPGVQFYREPSGSEKLASLPAGVKVPDVIQDIWAGQGAKVQADFEAEGYSIRFYLGDDGATSVQSVDVEARGASRPAMPLFEALTLATGWIVTDNWNRTIVAKGATIPEAK